MHDPKVVVFTIPRPWPRLNTFRPLLGQRWRMEGHFWTIAGHSVYWPVLVTVWHDEPGRADSGDVCKGMGGTELTWHNVRWAARHWRHLDIRLEPLVSLRRWVKDHCSECGRRFRRHEARFGYGWSAEREVYHNKCMSLRECRAQINDLHAYIDGRADNNQRFRVRYAQEKREARR